MNTYKPEEITIFTVKKIFFYNERYYTYGGFGLWLKDLSSKVDKIKLVAHITISKIPKGWYLLDITNIEYYWLPIPKYGELSVIFQLPYYFIKSINVIKHSKFVINRMPDYTGIIGAAISKFYRKKMIIIIIDDWAVQSRNTRWSKKGGLGLLLKLYLKVYDKFERLVCKNEIVLAQGHTAFLKHHKFAKKCVETYSTTLHPSNIVHYKMPFKGKREINIINVGRLTHVKNQSFLLNVIPHLKTLYPEINWKLKLIGEGPNEKKLKEICEKLNITHDVQFLGQIVHGNDLWDEFDKSDIFILSSLSEGTPKVVLEAMARKVVVVVPKIAALPFIIQHDYNGFLYDVNNQENLISVLHHVLSENVDIEIVLANATQFALNNTLQFRNEEIIKLIENIEIND